MGRPSKLSENQCNTARALHTKQHVPVSKLARKFKVSESSMYKVMDGSYQARKEMRRPPAGSSTKHVSNIMPPITKNLFPDLAPSSAPMMLDDDVVLQAACLIVSRSRFARMLKH